MFVVKFILNSNMILLGFDTYHEMKNIRPLILGNNYEYPLDSPIDIGNSLKRTVFNFNSCNHIIFKMCRFHCIVFLVANSDRKCRGWFTIGVYGKKTVFWVLVL